MSTKHKTSLSEYSGQDQIRVSHAIRHELKLKHRKVQKIAFKSNYFPALINGIDGFRPGELIIVSGPPKSGKTLLLQSMTYAFSQAGIDTLWFSYEVPVAQFILETFPQDMFPKFFLPQEIHAANMDWFEERTLEAWEKFQNHIVFIDHLHFLFDMAKSKSPSLELGSYIRRIKRFAVLHNLIVFLVCHIHKIKKDEILSYHHIRDTSFAAQEADAVWMIQRKKDKDGEIRDNAVLTVELHRRTGIMARKIPLMKQNGYLREVIHESKTKKSTEDEAGNRYRDQ